MSIAQPTTKVKKYSPGKAVAAASVGNALEWYDFSVFAFFATYIGHSFFDDANETSALINTFLVFGVGFIARPLGALFLGVYGDKAGRKAALTLTIFLMALGTVIIALAPPIWMIGVGAPILLLIGRLLQGFSVGGEIGGATAFLVESAPKEKRAFYASWLQASMGISNILAALMGVLITTLFEDKAIHHWAWRLPFIFGLLIVPVGYYIRKNLDETPEFQEQLRLNAAEPQKKRPLLDIFQKYPKHIIYGAMFSILWTVCVYTLIIYMPTYYSSAKIGLNFSSQHRFIASLCGNIFMVAGCLISGRLADHYGHKRILLISTALLLGVSYPLLAWLHAVPVLSVLICVHILFCIAVALFAGVAPVALAHIFPVEVRSTGMAVSYNIAAIFFAGFTPALLTWATSYSVMAPSYYLSLACIISFIAIILMYHLNHGYRK